MTREERFLKEIEKIQTEYYDLSSQMANVADVYNQNSPVFKRIKEGTDRQLEYLLQKADDMINTILSESKDIMITSGVNLEDMTFDASKVTPLKVEYNGEVYDFLGIGLDDSKEEVVYIADYSDNTVMIYTLKEFGEDISMQMLSVCSNWISTHHLENKNNDDNRIETDYSTEPL